MTDRSVSNRLDRHGLVMAFWTPSAFVAVCLLRFGVSTGVHGWTAAGFTVIIAAFVGHVIVNAVTRTHFTAGETALGAVVFAVALLGLLLGRLTALGGLDTGAFMALGLGLAALVAAVIVYLLIAFGPRRAFEKFDVIRDNNRRAASRLPHRGGRR